MKVNLKKLKGSAVYENGKKEPCGKIRDVCLSDDKNQVTAIQLETLSLIPLGRTMSIGDFDRVSGGKIILKNDIGIPEPKGVFTKEISGLIKENYKFKKIRDMQFDFETGEIFSFEISRGAFGKSDKIDINTMRIKDNNIYIE